MVDISSQNNKINVTVSSSGNTANTNVIPDYARYYSEKSKEWAISNKIVDNTDYSSKYYANESKKQADISTAKTTEVITSGNTAVSSIENARDNAITDITNQENLSVDNVNTAGVTQISSINTAGITQVANVNSEGTTQINLAKEQVTLASNQANIATQQATIATNKTTEVVESGNTALSNIDTAKTGAITDITDLKNTSITDITNLKNTSVSNITTAKDNAITTITTQETTSKNNVIATGNEQVERVNLTGVDNRTPIFSKSEIGINESVYQNIYDLKRSTFDLSKFTVVGSPTITDDGIASGFSSSNYIKASIPTVSSTSTFEIKIKFKLSEILSEWTRIWGAGPAGYSQVYIMPSGIHFTWTVNGTNYDSSISFSFTGTEDVIYTFGWNGTQIYSQANINGLDYTGRSESLATSIEFSEIYFANVGFTEGVFIGSIDLKQFSITVDGKEVFSGNKTGTDTVKIGDETVEIPYTLSKSGSKIVDVAHRNKVTALYNQEGKAKYYTIDEANKNFTLPMGEIYGMVGDSSSAGGGSLEICDIGIALYIDESKGLRRYLNGQIVDVNTNTQAFLNRLKQITTLHPSLLCTEEEWQTAKTMSAFGQVGKFVFNYSGDKIVSVRLPRVVNVQGLFDLQNLGMTVDESLPNIRAGKITTSDWGGIETEITGAWEGSMHPNYTNLNNGKSATEYFLSFNASRSSSTYQDNAPVQQEAIQYPYFIQIATGSETENNIINDIELNNPYSLFDSKYSDHELNNLSWLKSEGQWNAKAVYPTAYNELLTEYNNSASTTETEGSITFKRTPKGYKIALADQETAIDTKYATHGIAWYYILDTVNEKFKLPRTKFGFEGLRDKVGSDIAESLPNISGYMQGFGDRDLFGTGGYGGALSVMRPPSNKITAMGESYNATGYTGFDINASRSSSTYKDGAPVQERATQMYLYFYVGETVQNANLIDAGRIGEQLAGKVDLDLANLSSEGKEAMTAYWIASGSPTINIPINLTISTTTQYWEAPSNGYVWFYVTRSSSGAVGFIGVKEEFSDLWSIGNIGRGWLYINKGQHLSVRTDAGTFTLGALIFAAKQ